MAQQRARARLRGHPPGDTATACHCDFYYDNLNAEEPPDEPYPAWRTRLPDLSQFPEDTEAWRALDKKLLAKCLNFPNRVHASQNKIEVCAEYTMHELGNTLDEEASARGVEAWEIASALRNKYRLGRAEMIFDYYKVLKDALKRSIDEREKREERQASLLSELSAREKDFPE